MKQKNFTQIVLMCLLFSQHTFAQTAFKIQARQPVTVSCDPSEAPVVKTALELLERDCRAVFSAATVVDGEKGDIIVGTVGTSPLIAAGGVDVSALKGRKQAFLLAVSPEGKLVVAGSDRHGTAYGIMEICRLTGVSPWEWWADATPEKKETFTLPAGFRMTASPSVEFRGIFINDEDWGLMPWSSQTHEPSGVKGRTGAKTYSRVFELMLRLRANTLWPAMHECSVPFYMTAGNREAAEKYGIYIGSSHCEPLACNAAGEWDIRGKGDYNYITNRHAVIDFWTERLKELNNSDNIFTIGMRGKHDGMMQGVKTQEEHKNALDTIIADQRKLLKNYINEDVTKIPQVFIPYKEVLDVYDAGLKIPDDVTLVWCDDNYGYIRHFPTEEEVARKGGNGVYYHVSYWGRPHDYLWLGTTHPSLLYQQMNLAYEKGIRKIWIVNVGDIKPAEYLTELFLDMAWNPEAVKEEGVNAHHRRFLEREFGSETAERLQPVMQEYYRLAYIRKPEFMGNTREEERDPAYKTVKDLPWSESYIRERLNAYERLSDETELLSKQLSDNKREAYFQLIKYPVQAAAQMNRKLLNAQLARHGKADRQDSDAAFDSIAALTHLYNNGKWQRIMDFQPRKLPVFNRVKRDTASSPMPEERRPVHLWNGSEYTEGHPLLCEGLGYEGKAVALPQHSRLAFDFDSWETDSIEIEIRLLPNHPVNGKQLGFHISLDDAPAQTIYYETQGRSDEWKENVLRNQAIRRIILPAAPKRPHRLTVTAQDEGVVLDQIALYILKAVTKE
jgi:hypothetical protein